MVNMTLAIPNELHQKMKKFSHIRWTEIARKAIETKVQDLEALEKLVSKSKLTPKDIQEFTKKINKSAGQRFLET